MTRFSTLFITLFGLFGSVSPLRRIDHILNAPVEQRELPQHFALRDSGAVERLLNTKDTAPVKAVEIRLPVAKEEAYI